MVVGEEEGESHRSWRDPALEGRIAVAERYSVLHTWCGRGGGGEGRRSSWGD